jgi:MFS family permease
MFFFIVMADGVMSYIAPVVMASHLGSTTLMGLVLAISSSLGMCVDFYFSKQFPKKKSLFFNKILVATAIFFPLTFLLFRNLPSFILGMLIWGVYYEAMVFGNFHAVHELVKPNKHLWAWGIISLVKNVGWVIGPIAASLLDDRHLNWVFYLAIFGYAVGIILFFVRQKIHAHEFKDGVEEENKYRSLKQQVAIWKIYGKTVWPLLALILLFFLTEATFFTIGPVFGEQLRSSSPLGNLFVTMYTIPVAIFVLITGFFAEKFGKKRSAFLAGIFAGVCLIIMSRMVGVLPILIMTFVSSIGLGVLYPELAAVFQDFVGRTKKYGNDIIGLTAIMGSFAYVAGPIISGFLADHIGFQNVFGCLGVLLIIFSLIAFMMMKRKVRLPTNEVELKIVEILETERLDI